MQRIIKQTAAVLFSAALMQSTYAATDNAIRQGAIRGRVVDESAQTLPGASITIEDHQTGTVSDVNGFYTLSNLDPGTYTLKVSYVGYSPVVVSLTVSDGETLERDIILHSGVSLNEVIVGGVFQGQHKALNTQKNKLGIVNVISADQVSKFPDSNIGDALKRVSGVNVQYDQGEARFGQVRGTSPDFTSVTINGNRLPSAENEIRNVQLDLIPADMVQTIEVNKVVTSDMDGDAIGGSINLVTKNTPYRRVFNATAGSGYNWISDKAQLNLGLTYGDRFFNNKLGVMAAVSYQNAPIGSDNTEFEYDLNDDGEVVLQEAQVRQYYVTRERQSYSLSLDYDLNANHKFSFKGIYNRRNDWENRYALVYKDIDEGAGEMKAEIETKGGSYGNRNARLELQQTMDFSLGGEHLFGQLSMDWDASYARASEDRPDERYFKLQQEDQTFDFVDVGEKRPYTTTPVSLHEGTWEIDELTNADEDVTEEDWKFRMNFELPLFKGRFGNVLKFGVKYAGKSKDNEVVCYDYKDAYTGTDYLQHLSSQIRNGFMPGVQYEPHDFVNKQYLGSFNFDTMEGEQVLEESAGNYNANENITSAYLRFDQKLGNHMQLTVGVRMERTGLKYSGWNWVIDEDENESLEPTGEQKHHYVNWLPSILYKWDVTDDFKLRASYTKTLARPNYSDLVPSASINRHDNEITLGNSDLTPTFSNNYDISLDYYFKSVGLVSAGFFYKDVKNFIVDQQTIGDYQGLTNADISQPVNAGDATLYGVEVAFQRDFGFIAPALKCVGFYGNYTYTHSEVENFNFEGRENEKGLPLPGSAKHTANASLYFEKSGVNLRLSYNYASDFIDEMGKHASLDRYYDAVNYLDINASYTFGKKYKLTIYAEATNLLNQPLRYYQGEKNRTMQVEYYGVKANAGIKVSF